MIGGDYCNASVQIGSEAKLLSSEGLTLTQGNIEFLWRIFVAIGNNWKNVRYESSNLKSSWLEMIEAKTSVEPSYTGEYLNAITCVLELINIYGEEQAFFKLFFANGIPKADFKNAKNTLNTNLSHAKKFVIDEFIRMQVIASGFKHFGGANYAGYVKGSRYSLNPEVREYVEKELDTYNQK